MTNCWATNILDLQPRQMRNSGHKCRHFPLDPFFLISQNGNNISSLVIFHLLESYVREVKNIHHKTLSNMLQTLPYACAKQIF